MFIMLKFDNVNKTQEGLINNWLKNLNNNKTKTQLTYSERVYSYVRYLQSINLTEKQVFDIFTNTMDKVEK